MRTWTCTAILILAATHLSCDRNDTASGGGGPQPSPGSAPPPATTVAANASGTVVVNGVQIPESQLLQIQQTYGYRIPPSRLWYDRFTGAWGTEDGPALGIGIAGVDLGGPLRADASHGDTGVFVNGRELHQVDVVVLSKILSVHGLSVQRGRYWMDSGWNCGIEGGAPMFNLAILAQQSAVSAGGGGPIPMQSGLWGDLSKPTPIGIIPN